MDTKINFLENLKTEKKGLAIDQVLLGWAEKTYARITLWDWLDIFSLSALCFLANFLMDISFLKIFLIFFAAAHLYWRLPSRLPFALAILCLIASPVAMKLFETHWLFSGEIWSNRLSIIAFGSLGIGIIAQLLEIKNRIALVRQSNSRRIIKPEKIPDAAWRSDAILAVYHPPHTVNLKGALI